MDINTLQQEIGKLSDDQLALLLVPRLRKIMSMMEAQGMPRQIHHILKAGDKICGLNVTKVEPSDYKGSSTVEINHTWQPKNIVETLYKCDQWIKRHYDLVNKNSGHCLKLPWEEEL